MVADEALALNPWHWPRRIPYEVSLRAFEAAFATRGFVPCEDATLEEGFAKVAIYATRDEPTHVALQLPNGRWTSKIGVGDEDIEHALEGLIRDDYGEPRLFLRRPRSSEIPPSD